MPISAAAVRSVAAALALLTYGIAMPAASAQTPKNAAKANAETSAENKRATPNRFMNIQEVKSPGGITAWLVESRNVPLMAMRFAFDGGGAQDPTGKAGLANFMSGMLDEGAGDLDATTFQERVEEIAMRMGFQSTRDHFYGSFETLTVNRDKAIELLRLAVTKPTFGADAVERVKNQIVSQIAVQEKDPEQVAARAWSKLAFGNHPYSQPSNGTKESVAAITSADLATYHKRVFARSTLRVVAVGDIDAKTLGALLDKVFADLPAKPDLTEVPAVSLPTGGEIKVIEMPVPQSAARFGMPGMLRKDPDFMAATVINQILGGGGFASRLMEEVREKRGLAYGVYSFMSPLARAGAFAGGVATKNSEMVQSLDVIKAEIRSMAEKGPTQKELDNAKGYLVGSYPLRFDTNAKISNELLGLMVEDLGIDYINKRNAEIEAVTMADAKRVAAKLLKTDDMLIAVVGKPEGLKSTSAK